MIQEDILDDIETACDYLHNHSDSIVSIKQQSIIDSKKGEGVRPFLELIRDASDSGDSCTGRHRNITCEKPNRRLPVSL